MEAKNLAEMYKTPLLDWDAIETRLRAGVDQAPGNGGPGRHRPLGPCRPDEELLAGLVKVQAVVTQAGAAVHDHVEVLRGRGISWTRIGEALGLSKQAAWERFSGED